MLNQFSRVELALGAEALSRIKNSRICIAGIGGVGSFAAEALARTGCMNITLIDFDTICITNLNRQIQTSMENVGELKVFEMKSRIEQINPHAQVSIVAKKLNQENTLQILDREFDYVIDAVDDVNAKISIIEYCYRNKISLISSMGAANKIDPCKIRVADISKTHTDPLARVIRSRLRKVGIDKGVEVVFSEETPLERNAGIHSECGESQQEPQKVINGSLIFVTAAVGLTAASVAIRGIAANS